MIKSIIFDVGGVYMEGSFVDFVNNSYKILGLDKTFKADDLVTFDTNLNKGLISHVDCFRNFFQTPISDSQMDKILDVWMNTWRPTEEMIDLVQRLQNKYVLAILSNSDSLNSAQYTKRGWYSYFQNLILSHEIGILKPDREIYEITLQKIGLPADQCLFIDDQEKALVPARELGMKTIHFQSLSQLKADLSSCAVEY